MNVSMSVGPAGPAEALDAAQAILPRLQAAAAQVEQALAARK